MESKISNRIVSLQTLLRDNNIDAVIIYSSDPHMSEYLPEHWKKREWISGFTGSAGTCVITQSEAGLWTDSRYYLQAEEELKDSPIQLYKDGLEDTLSIYNFIRLNVKPGGRVAIDGEMVSIAQYNNLLTNLHEYSILTSSDCTEALWKDRPSLPKARSKVYETSYTGESATAKISRIKRCLNLKDTTFIVSALDEIAWTLNIRGSEINNNPVVISYLTISETDVILYIDKEKVDSKLAQYLLSQGVRCEEYNQIFNNLSHLESNALIDPRNTNIKICNAIRTDAIIQYIKSPITLFKAIRNKIEIKNVKNAMIKDGISLVQFLIWLESNTLAKITEIDISNKLYELRAQHDSFRGESFDTIAGYKEHAAIVHYTASPQSNKILENKGLLLVDSGAQYLEGTTDITRTIPLGEVTQEEAQDYTLVLKGHINLAMAKFPKGTRGSQLDILARQPLWGAKKNFLHGTGHGVGHYLCVHEGPQSIRMQENETTLELGMLTSNEPGVYISNSHGVRIENLILVIPFGEGLFGDYYQFETVTLCPIDTRCILKDLLSNDEISWLNNYHKTVYNKLSPHLSREEREWLSIKTKEI